MLRLYKYCFYRITRFWDHPVHYSLSYDPLTQKVDPTPIPCITPCPMTR